MNSFEHLNCSSVHNVSFFSKFSIHLGFHYDMTGCDFSVDLSCLGLSETFDAINFLYQIKNTSAIIFSNILFYSFYIFSSGIPVIQCSFRPFDIVPQAL